MPRDWTVVAWTGLTEALIALIANGGLLIFDDCLGPCWPKRMPCGEVHALQAKCRRCDLVHLLLNCHHYTIQIWP